VSRLAATNATAITTLEINPVLVMNEGEGILALDAVIETGTIT
jgi:succinyl-CoA synthetase beta subunit